MSNAIQLRTETMDDWQVIRQQAEVLVKTGFLPQAIKTAEQALAVILTGRELGIGAMQALQTINVIQGKPTVSPQLMLALINRSGQVEDLAIQATKDGATCTIKRRGRTAYTAKFGPAEAAAMGLNGKDNYKKQPATMYKWRAVADACRVVFPDVILGVYTPDEMDAAVEPESGEVVETAPLELEAAPELTPEPVVAEPESTPRPQQKRPVRPRGNAGQIVALAEALKWNDKMIADVIYERFKMAIGTDVVAALEELPKLQQQELIQAMKAELELRTKAAHA